MSPAAAHVLKLLAEGYHAERDEDGRYSIVLRAPWKRDQAELDRAVYEIGAAGLVDSSANGSGNCWINDAGRASVTLKGGASE